MASVSIADLVARLRLDASDFARGVAGVRTSLAGMTAQIGAASAALSSVRGVFAAMAAVMA